MGVKPISLERAFLKFIWHCPFWCDYLCSCLQALVFFFSFYELNLMFWQIADVVNISLDRFFPEDEIRVIAEPGRFYVASAFSVVTNIIAKRVVARDQHAESKLINSAFVCNCCISKVWMSVIFKSLYTRTITCLKMQYFKKTSFWYSRVLKSTANDKHYKHHYKSVSQHC